MKNLFIAILLLLTCQMSNAQSLHSQRESMVRIQIENRGVRHQPTLKAMRVVQRHRFVPDALISRAYDDSPLPIGYGQTISQPFIVAYMTGIIDPKPHYKVLEIGCGSGYQAAVLAEIVSHVYTIEIVPELGQRAKKLLSDLDFKNITVKTADGYYGWEEYGPFDAIVVTAAAEFIPPPLIAQLKEGGKMIIPVGSPFLTQNLILVEKKDGKTTTRNLMPVRFVPFTRNSN